ncbi:MAG: hypothetical protein J6T52_11220 [Bacteroidaceae bacterium]|nr:hypothetical protein [Bacteroidaceae bacterium]
MNKKSLLLAVFAAVGLSANAQQILKIGFESDEPKGVYTTKDSTQFAGFFADHINLQADDTWNEQGTDAHSGEYALEVDNTNTFKGNPWDRGFKIRNIQLEDNTSYRISYWVKADPQYEASDGSRGNTSIKNTLSIGFEQVEAPTVAPSGSEYYFNYTSGMTGEWRHIKNVTFFTNKALQDKYFTNYNKNIKEITEAGDTIYYSAGMTEFAEQYFITINLYNPGIYMLDDIVLEKATIAGATFTDYAIRIDFGYPTNISALAKNEGGSLVLDPAQVSVKVGDQVLTPDYLEGKPDGYLYAFFEEVGLEETDVVELSFTPAEDCPIIYTNEKRPSADIEGEVKVLPFSAEIADWDETIEQIPSAWEAPELVRTVPENESFELKASDVANVYFFYNKEIDLSTASVVLYSNGKSTDLTKFMNLTSDSKGIICGTGAPLADGEYIVRVSGVQSTYGETCTSDQEVSFQVGVDTDTSESETVYASDFDHEMTGGVPEGWITYNEAGYHLYAFNDDGSQMNYNWGGNPGGGGTRLYEGFSGDFNKAMYWGSRGTNEGWCTFGEQVKDYTFEDGSIDPEMPEGVALKLEARKYQVKFLMAAWKGEPTFTFTLEDLNGNVYAEFKDILAAPNVNGATGKVTGSVKCVTDFVVPTPGYYVLRFTAAEAQWQEYLLANLQVITMPSKAAYYKQQLNVALEAAKAVLADAEDAVYNGDTKTALITEIAKAEAGGFTAPSQVQAEIDLLEEIAAALTARIKNIDDFNIAKDEAAIAMSELQGTKYENTEAYQTASGIMSQYGETNPTDLADDVLAELAPTLTNAAAQLGKVKGCSDLLTWGLFKATQTATTIATAAEDAINAAYEATTDDREVAKALNYANKMRIYELIINGELSDDVMTELYDNLNADSLVTKGIELTGAIQNPKFYREYGKDGFPGWTITGNTPGFGGSAPTAIEYVTSSGINSYGNNNYDMSQTLEDLPVGIYAVELDTRTPDNCKAINGYGYNAQNDETGVWDMYSYAQGDGDAEQSVRPYRAAGSGSSPVGVIHNIQVKEGTLTFGVHEQYVSGKAMDSTGNPTDFWTGTSQVGNARLFFVAPLPGFDYATGIENLKADVELNAVRKEFYTVSGVRTATAQKGINIVKMYDANGRSITKKIVK